MPDLGGSAAARRICSGQVSGVSNAVRKHLGGHFGRVCVLCMSAGSHRARLYQSLVVLHLPRGWTCVQEGASGNPACGGHQELHGSTRTGPWYIPGRTCMHGACCI
eukprot:3258750-Prymnesium_polylepis.2